MEVKRVTRADIKKEAAKTKQVKGSINFSQLVTSKQSDAQLDRFQQLAKDIEDQGKILSETQTVEDLRKYKKLVKSLLTEAVNGGLELTEQRGFGANGRARIYKIVKEVDKRLLDITEKVLDKEKKGIDLLGAIGEIQGLIINIYT